MQHLWFVGSLSLIGCDLDPGFDLNPNPDATTITATAQSNGKTVVAICPGPRGVIGCGEAEGFDVVLGSQDEDATAGVLSFGEFQADFPTNQADSPISVSRMPDGAVANASLPAPFDLTGPAATDSVSRGSKIEVAWNPSGSDRMTWSADVACGTTEHFNKAVEIDDTGTLTISTDDFPDTSGSCTAYVSLTRERDGIAGAGYPAGSTFVADQVRAVAFQLAP